MKRIAIVEKNRCHFEELEKYAASLLYMEFDKHNDPLRKKIKEEINGYIWSVMNTYIKFIDVHECDLMLTICENLIKCFPEKTFDDFFYHTEESYSFPQQYIELVYCFPLWKDYENSKIENINNIGCLFSLKHSLVENNCAILINNYDSSAKNFVVIDSITQKDILRVIRRRFFFSAVVIKNDDLKKYYYQSPKYLIKQVFGLDESDGIQKVSFNLYNYNLTYYFKQDKTNYINKIATRINGNYKIYGDVIVIHEMEENVFANISLHEVKRLNVLAYGTLSNREVKKEETQIIIKYDLDENNNNIEHKIIPSWNKYTILNNRMIKWKEIKNKCMQCTRDITHTTICENCYRIKFCSNECMNLFKINTEHCKECNVSIEINQPN